MVSHSKMSPVDLVLNVKFVGTNSAVEEFVLMLTNIKVHTIPCLQLYVPQQYTIAREHHKRHRYVCFLQLTLLDVCCTLQTRHLSMFSIRPHVFSSWAWRVFCEEFVITSRAGFTALFLGKLNVV